MSTANDTFITYSLLENPTGDDRIHGGDERIHGVALFSDSWQEAVQRRVMLRSSNGTVNQLARRALLMVGE